MRRSPATMPDRYIRRRAFSRPVMILGLGLMISGTMLLVQPGCQPPASAVDPATTEPAEPSTKPDSKHQGKTANVPTKPQADKQDNAWIDLFDGKTLAGWKVPNFGGEGEVTVEEGTIVLGMGMPMTGVVYSGDVPRSNYELVLEGMRVEGNDFFCTTTFPVGKEYCSLVLGGWGGTVVGLSNVDYYDASDNFTTTFLDFKDKRWYRVRIQVTEAKIEAWVDDEQVVDQEREGHEFDTRMEVDLCQPLGICSYETTGAVRNVRLRRVAPSKTTE